MDIILVPGFWLDASSWDDVAPSLTAAGHRVQALTLPGLESVETDRSGIGLADHVDAVVARIDAADSRVVLVGHSGGGTVIHGAVDQRPDRVARAIYVDAAPTPDGQATNADLPGDADVPLPPWEVFDGSDDLRDLDEAQLESFRARAIPHPAGAARDPQVLRDERRYDVPATLITTTFPRAQIDQLVEQGHPYTAEIGRIADLTIVELPTGHWPQFTRPAELAQAILDAVG